MIVAAVDPAWVNLFFLVCLMLMHGFFARMMYTLRDHVLKQAEESVRIAKGSERRAEAAAAEIKITRERAEKALAEVVILGRAIKHKLALLRVESELRDAPAPKGDPSRSWPFDRPEEDDEGPR
jgi:hypothetical protein